MCGSTTARLTQRGLIIISKTPHWNWSQACVLTYSNSTKASKPRLDFSGAFYHALACGNRRATIFHDDAGCHDYLTRLKYYRQRDGVTLHAYE